MMNLSAIRFLVTLLLIAAVGPTTTHSSGPHKIVFRSKDLFPEGLAYDPSAEHFLASSTRLRTIVSVSDAAVVETLISDLDLPENSTFLGLAVDNPRRRLLAAVNAPRFSAVAAYDLRSPLRSRLFLSVLPPADSPDRKIANDVALDPAGNAYVTNSAGNFIWKVNPDGQASVFSNSSEFSSSPVLDPTSAYSFCGLNGIVRVSQGYFLVVQSNSGKLFKVREDDGEARRVSVGADLVNADGIVVRSDGVAFVSSAKKVWVLKSADSWREAEVFDEIALVEERFGTSLAVGREERVYLIFGHAWEGMMGNSTREVFGIEEVCSERENRDDRVWIYVLVGFGFVYFLVWRFQMRSLISNMDRKNY